MSGSRKSLLAVSPDQAGMPGLHASMWINALWGETLVGPHNTANREHIWDDRVGHMAGARV